MTLTPTKSVFSNFKKTVGMKRNNHILNSLFKTYVILICTIVSLLISCNDSNTPSDAAITDTPQENLSLQQAANATLIGGHFAFTEDTNYLNISEQEFNANQVLFYAGFGGWPSREEFNLSLLNTSINWLVERNIEPHIHMLFGPNFYMPDWLKNNEWSAEELDTLMQELIEHIMMSNANKSKVKAWNVLNELFNDDGTYRTDMVWNGMGFENDVSGIENSQKINEQHPIFIRKAFEYCRNFTEAKLEYRDYLIENNNPIAGWDEKHKATYQLLAHLKETGVPVDAVGIQGHYDIGNTDWIFSDNQFQDAVARFSSLGLEVYLTEIDIGTTFPWSAALAEQQRNDYSRVIGEALRANISRIYTWGVHDGRDATWRTNEHPLLWDENLEKKPAYFGVLEALKN